jgi:hypothetical protein
LCITFFDYERFTYYINLLEKWKIVSDEMCEIAPRVAS